MLNLQNATYSRLPHFLFVFTLFLAGATASYAQKIDIDKKWLNLNVYALPTKDVDTSLHTVSYQFNGEYVLPGWGIDPIQAKKSYCRIAGYQTVESGGDFHLEINLLPIQFLDSRVDKRTTVSKDQSGRQTTTTYYQEVHTYNYNYNWKLMDKNGSVVSKGIFDGCSSGVVKFTGKESTDSKAVYASFNNNRVQTRLNIASDAIWNSMAAMHSALSSNFGYVCTSERFGIWVLDTKDHPEYETMKTHQETLKALFAKLRCSDVSAEEMEAIKPSIDYYNSIPQKYTADEKADKKLRYAAYFNLANIYLRLDDVANVKKYANLIIENDYDKKEGKEFIQDAENLIQIFERTHLRSRRIQRN